MAKANMVTWQYMVIKKIKDKSYIVMYYFKNEKRNWK